MKKQDLIDFLQNDSDQYDKDYIVEEMVSKVLLDHRNSEDCDLCEEL